jgi:enamine deaminase RidA (YjgF/YER057c/UK114 family)
VFRDAVSGPRPGGPYSPGIVAEGRFVFVSGQGPVMNGVYADVFPDPKPARATVQAQLGVGRVEIDCIAVVPGD